MATYPIPEEFLSNLEVVQLKDLRSDAEILTAPREHHLVSSERNIWAYWHGGADDVWALHKATFCGLSERCAIIFAWWSEPRCGLYPGQRPR
ncbi:hypothetical protein V493_00168 [Pseudogymnoascus sp. VKM F-4281 (FW-2241)]|nr:hypothetical protein V493_00168 [Pseudogymnoascus sp. VKM F-4281 (FW-2241)]